MLQSLQVKNYALINDIHVDLNQGLTIITGETGAGKSILLGALSLILGKRADLSAIKDRNKKCIVEGVFHIDSYNLNSLFEAESIDYESETIIRREILPSGKSRAFINDTPVNLNTLESVGSKLIDIHSQHQNQELTENLFQFQVLDAVANNQQLLNEYNQVLLDYKQANRTLVQLTQKKAEAIKEQDYNAFLLNELNDANLVEGELEQLEAEQETLSNVEDIKHLLQSAYQLLSDDQAGIVQMLNELKNALKNLSTLSSAYTDLYSRIESSAIEVDDIFNEVDSAKDTIDADPERLLEINNKLSTLQSLMLKHSAHDLQELIAVKEELAKKVMVFETIDDDILRLENEKNLLENKLLELCDDLHIRRVAVGPELEKRLESYLSELGIVNAKFKINLTQDEDFYATGNSQLQFLFSANKGGVLQPLKKAASGGELSRIMLAIKAILATYDSLPTIIFDEIDTGVSGEISKKMGEMMFDMSTKMQVFAITHLPQIAAKGDHHFKVFKTDINNVSSTQLAKLNNDQRIEEIAEMLEGKKASSSAIAHAKQLLN